MPIRASTSDVIAHVRTALTTDARAAAGNDLLSHAEQGTLSSTILRDAADQVRAAGGPGTRVSVTALVDQAVADVERLFSAVNQASGPGQSTVSQDEVRALAARNAEAGGRVARAYELITGKTIPLDGPTPPPPAPGPAGRLAITGVSVSSQDPRNLRATVIGGHTLELKGGTPSAAALHIDLGGRRIDVALPGSAYPWFLVPELRRVAPDLDVRVVEYARNTIKLELHPAGTAPKGIPLPLSGDWVSSDPARAGSIDFKRAGQTGVSAWNVDTVAGEKLTLDVEGKSYEVTADASTPKVIDLFRAMGTKLRADGWRVDAIDYSPNIYCSLKFEMP